MRESTGPRRRADDIVIVEDDIMIVEDDIVMVEDDSALASSRSCRCCP